MRHIRAGHDDTAGGPADPSLGGGTDAPAAPVTAIPSPRVPPGSAMPDPMRSHVAGRLRLMAVRHCGNVAQTARTRRAVARHALGFFYVADVADVADVAGAASGDPVVTATRLPFADPETADVVRMLETLYARAAEYDTGTLEPRVHLCNRVEHMRADAPLLGLGVTTVGDDAGRSAASELGLDRAFRAVGYLLDGTIVLVQRPLGVGESVQVYATQTLDLPGATLPHRLWRGWTPYLLQDDPELAPLLERLTALTELVVARRATGLGRRIRHG